MLVYRLHSTIVFDCNINGHKFIKVGNTVKDLDIVFDTKLIFFPRIISSSCKALTILGYVKRVYT